MEYIRVEPELPYEYEKRQELYKKYKLQEPEFPLIKSEENMREYRQGKYYHALICAYLENNLSEQLEYIKTFDYYKYLKRAEQWISNLIK